MQTMFSNTGEITEPTKLTTRSHRIHSRNRLEKHLSGTRRCRMVAYTMNLKFIEEYIEKIGIQQLDVIIGKEVALSRRRSMDPDFLVKLAKWQAQGVLNVRVPVRGEMHEKFFFCWNEHERWFRDVNGSANPTERGSGSSVQSNRITVTQIDGAYESHEYHQNCLAEWEKYVEMSAPFLDSLLELLPDEEEDWRPVVVKWIESDGSVENENTIEIQAITMELQEGMFQEAIRENPEFTMSIQGYADSSVEKAVELLNHRGAGIEYSGGRLNAPVGGLNLLPVTSQVSAPRMNIVDDELWLILNGEKILRSTRDVDSEQIAMELQRLNLYVESVKHANRGDEQAMMALGEFILSTMNAPFEHLYMTERRKRFRRQKEGPRMTSYVGSAGNGKSYACRYVLRMLTAEHMEAMSSSDFTKSAVLHAAGSGSIFPLIFDDLEKKRITEWGKWGKMYWDSAYRDGRAFPQLIVTANDRIDSGGPLGRRVREIPMHAAYSNNQKNSEYVETLLEDASQIFPYFAGLMLDDVRFSGEHYDHGDELSKAREVMYRLYKIAKMKPPKWIVPKPLEQVVDTQALEWLNLIDKRLCEVRSERDEIIVKFDGEGAKWDANGKRKLLPTSVGAEMVGSKIRIRNPAEFVFWLSTASHAYSGSLRRQTRRLLRQRFD